MQSPQVRDGLGVDQLEDASVTVGPLDVARTVVIVVQQLQQELPQVGRAAVLTRMRQPRRCRCAPARRQLVTGVTTLQRTCSHTRHVTCQSRSSTVTHSADRPPPAALRCGLKYRNNLHTPSNDSNTKTQLYKHKYKQNINKTKAATKYMYIVSK